MTGFGTGRAPVVVAGSDVGDAGSTGNVVVELRATNHKYCDVRVTTPRELLFLAGPAEARIRSHVARGTVDARLAIEGEALTRLELDPARARATFAALSRLAEELAPGTKVPVEALLSLPDLFVTGASARRHELEEACSRAMDVALGDLLGMQALEGNALADDMASRLTRLLELAELVAARQPEVLAKRRERLLARTRELLEAAAASAEIAQSRVELEIVLLADRYDTTEEKTRLLSHVKQCVAALLPSGPTPAGKRLDFLLQEVSREITTMGAKSEDAEIAHVVVEMKTEAAKLREQVQNIV